MANWIKLDLSGYDNQAQERKGPWKWRILPISAELPGGRLSIKRSSRYRDPHVKDYKNPLHIDLVDRYLRRMGDKMIPDEAWPSLESFYPPWVAGIDLPQSRCCGFFVSFTNKHK